MLSSPVQERRPRDLAHRLTALGASFSESRGSRFARRAGMANDAKPQPTLADLVNLPDWILCDVEMVDDIAAVTTLLHFRPALDRELSGARLSAICECVGEGNYDLACEAPIPETELIADTETKLPTPDQLNAVGRTMLNQALPITMIATVSEASGNIKMKALSNIATALVLARKTALTGQPA